MATVLEPLTVNTPLEITGVAPIIIDLGKEKKKRIRDLKRGRGRLMAEVAAVLNDARATLGDNADGKQIVPVILIYKKKRKKGRKDWGGRSLFPLLF